MVADTPKKAIELIDKEAIDVVLLDILLPDVDGVRLLKIIKEKNPSIHVIMMTGYSDGDQIFREVHRLGAEGFVHKSEPFDQMLMEVHRVLKEYKHPV